MPDDSPAGRAAIPTPSAAPGDDEAPPPGMSVLDAHTRATVAERVPLSRLHSMPGNARTHDPRNLDAIKRSLSRFGQTFPLLALPDGTVIAGNGRLAAMLEMGWAECDVKWLHGWDSIRARAYAIADNRTAETADWDLGALKLELEGLLAADVPLIDLGFDDSEAAQILAAAWRPRGDDNPDEVAVGRHTIVLAEEQWSVVQTAIERMQHAEPDGKNLQPAEVVVRLAEAYNRDGDA